MAGEGSAGLSAQSSAGPSTASHLAFIVGLKALVGAVVLWGGFRAVSDDDFARVVLAQQWAFDPKLDPTGTSWLPFPFWTYGGAMTVFGTSLDMARATAFALGLVSAVLLYGAARLLVDDAREALVGASLACVVPWAAYLGVATVPELPTAALTVFAVATLASSCPRLRVAGGAALLVACLSRYEPWIVAAAFATLTGWDLLRSGQSSDGRAPDDGQAARRLWLAAGALLACLGPALWMAHNAAVHGSAWHFAARVSAYARAVGGQALHLLEGYPLSLVREEPELCSLAGALLLAALLLRKRLPSSFWRTTAVLAVMLAALSLAAPTGGVPTHHAGRALLAVWLVMAIYTGAAGRRILRGPGWGASPSGRGRARWVFTACALTALIVGATVLRPWYAQLDSFTPRRHETAIGEQVRALVPASARVLLEVRDFRYFAVQAGSGDPGMFVLDRSVDPRGRIVPSSFQSVDRLKRRVDQAQASHWVGYDNQELRTLGDPLATAGPWAIWQRSLTPARAAGAGPPRADSLPPTPGSGSPPRRRARAADSPAGSPTRPAARARP